MTLTHSRYCSAARVQRNPQPVIGFSRSLRSAILGQSFQPTGPLGVAEVVARVYQSGLGSLKANAVDDFQCAAPLARAPMTDEQNSHGSRGRYLYFRRREARWLLEAFICRNCRGHIARTLHLKRICRAESTGPLPARDRSYARRTVWGELKCRISKSYACMLNVDSLPAVPELRRERENSR